MKQSALDKINRCLEAALLVVATATVFLGILMVSNCAAKTTLPSCTSQSCPTPTPTPTKNLIVRFVGPDRPPNDILAQILIKTNRFCREVGKAGVAEIAIRYNAKEQSAAVAYRCIGD